MLVSEWLGTNVPYWVHEFPFWPFVVSFLATWFVCSLVMLIYWKGK